MSATESHASSDAAAGDLTPVLSARWALRGKHLGVCLLFGGLFVYLDHLPLADGSIWLYLCRGERALGRLAPLMADTSGTAGLDAGIVNTCWLSEMAYAAAHRWGGVEYVSHLFALIALAYLVVLARVFYLQTRRVGLMAFGVTLAAILGAGHPIAAGPAVFGALCLAVLLWIVTRLSERTCETGPADAPEMPLPGRGNGALWLALIVLFVAWANLHGSFLLGIVVLGCCALGRVTEVGCKTRRASRVISDRVTQQWVLLTGCAIAASLVNPDGPGLLAENVRIAASANLRETGAWLPLRLPTLSAVSFLLCLVLLSVVLRHSRRAVRPGEVLLLISFGLLVLPTRRTLGWFGPVFVFAAMPHLGDVLARLWPIGEPSDPSPEPAPRRPHQFAVTLLCGLVVWCAFALAPISQDILGGEARTTNRVRGPRLPHELIECLGAQPSPGRVFTPLQWADWLVYRGPVGLQVYMTSDVHRATRSVWEDYQRIIYAAPGWEQAADRHGVGTVVLGKRQQVALSGAIHRSPGWEIVWEDETALLARRVQAPTEEPCAETRISNRKEAMPTSRSQALDVASAAAR